MRFRPGLLACALLLVPIAVCAEESAPCRVTGGGCLNVPEPGHHLQATFGGNIPSLHGPWQGFHGATGSSWEHVFRDGKTILFNFLSTDVHVVRCRPERSGPCPPPDGAKRVEFEGTGKFSAGTGPQMEVGNVEGTIVDAGRCTPGTGDWYSIRVRRGLAIGFGEVVYEVSGEIDCGNLQAHTPWENPPRR